jgi:hypothetical protein
MPRQTRGAAIYLPLPGWVKPECPRHQAQMAGVEQAPSPATSRQRPIHPPPHWLRPARNSPQAQTRLTARQPTGEALAFTTHSASIPMSPTPHAPFRPQMPPPPSPALIPISHSVPAYGAARPAPEPSGFQTVPEPSRRWMISRILQSALAGIVRSPKSLAHHSLWICRTDLRDLQPDPSQV